MANVMAMRELVKPDGLGGFKVLLQAKGDVAVERWRRAGRPRKRSRCRC